MKRLLTAFMLAACIGLASCGEASMSSGQMKGNLEGKGYTVEVMGKTEAEARIQGIKYVVDIKDALISSKGQDQAIIAFFCANINDADKLVKENIQAMHGWAQRYTEEPKVGSHNNVAYAGSFDAVAAAGIPVSK